MTSLLLGGNRVLAWLGLAAVVLLTFLFQLWHDLSAKDMPRPPQLILPGVLFLGVLLWALVQSLPILPASLAHPNWLAIDGATATATGSPGLTRHATLRFATYGMIFWLALRCAETSKNSQTLVAGFGVFSTLLAVFGLYAVITGSNVILRDAQDGYLSASFMNRNHYATFAAFGMLANLAAYLQFFRQRNLNESQRSSLVRDLIESFFDGAWLFALGFALCLVALAYTQSRAGALSGGVGLFVFLWLWTRRASMMVKLFLWVAAAGAIAFALFATGGDIFDRILNPAAEEYRPELYRATWAGIMDRPWTGHGFGSFEDTGRIFLPQNLAFAEAYYAHNTYLESAFGLGLPAAIALYAMWILLLIKPIRALGRARQDRPLIVLSIAACSTAAVHAAFDFSLQIPAVMAVLAMILGVAWGRVLRIYSERGH